MAKECLWTMAIGLLVAFLAGCAATTQEAVMRIPEGKGQLILDAGGINQLDFKVVDQATNEVVVDRSGRGRWALSPGAYERTREEFGLYEFLPPGTYKLVVDTDLNEDEPIVIEDVEITAGRETWQPVRVGRFSVTVLRTRTAGGETEQWQVQMPFTVYDYGFNHILGRGMTSTQVKHFIARVGNYKVRVDARVGAGVEPVDQIQDVPVEFGRVYPVRFEFGALEPMEQMPR